MCLTLCILSSVLIIAKAELEADKLQACDRGIKIVAASKTEEKGIFHIFEDWKAWLYDAENQKILEFFDIETEIQRHSPNSPIIRATRIRTCLTPDGFGLENQQFMTSKKKFEYEDLRNASSWKIGDEKSRKELMAERFSLDISYAVLTVGSACAYENGGQTNYIHVFASKDPKLKGVFRFCRSAECKGQKPAVHPPFTLEKTIKETSTIPDALSLDFDVLKSNPRILFVIGGQISYWIMDENGKESLSEAAVDDIFGCESEASKLMVIVYVVVGVVFIVIVLGAVIVAVVFLRSKTSFEDEQTTTVYNTKAKAKRIGK